MFGRNSERDTSAQLALMDAMVFFAVSTIICATLASYVVREGEEEAEGPTVLAGADGLLAVYLQASLGRSFILGADGLELTGREQIGEILYLVAALAVRGHDLSVCDPVFEHCLAVLDGLCEPWSPSLTVSLVGADRWIVLVELGEEAISEPYSYAASQNLGMCDSVPVMVSLVLHPALLPHLLEV